MHRDRVPPIAPFEVAVDIEIERQLDRLLRGSTVSSEFDTFDAVVAATLDDLHI